MSRSSRHLAACVASAALLSWWGCAEDRSADRLLVAAATGDLVFSGSFYGELEARKSIAIHTPDLAGISSLTVDSVLADGTHVKKDQVVLSFVKGPVEDELRENEAELAVAKADMRRVAENLATERINLQLDVQSKVLMVDRAKLNVVVGVNLISKLELDKAKLDLKRARLDLDLSRKALRLFAAKRKATLDVQRMKVAAIQDKADEKRKNLVSMDVKAPAGGVIFGPYTRLNWVRGKVMPGSVTRGGDKLLEIPELDAYDVAVYVRQRDASLIKTGDRAKVSVTMMPEERLIGVVVRKEDFAATRNERLGTKNAEGNLKEIKVVMTLDRAPKQLRPGGTARADLSTRLAKKVLILPLAALTEIKDGYEVMMADGSRRAVKIGRSSMTHAEVLKGVAEGEKVQLGTKSPYEQRAAGPGKQRLKRKRGSKKGKRPRRGGGP